MYWFTDFLFYKTDLIYQTDRFLIINEIYNTQMNYFYYF